MSNFHVILIEDEPYQRLIANEILVSLDYEVTLAEDGHKAWDLLSKHQFDLILLDLELPGMDGLEILSKIKDSEQLKHVPVVICSASHEMEKVYKSLDLGAIDFLMKPIKRTQVKQIVDQIKENPVGRSPATESSLKAYERIRKLGQGSYAVVYLVRSQSTGELFALKRMDLASLSSKERANAETEVMLMKVLAGPTIIRFVDQFTDDTVINIVMEYAEGGTLAERLKVLKEQSQALDKVQIYAWLGQLIIALMMMHSKNILHRDLKSQNLFLTQNNVIKVGDMGIAKSLNSSRDMAESLAGTPYNMAPEIMKGERYGQKTDIWSLGCVLYEMITFRRPFEGPNLGLLREAIINAEFHPILGNIDSNLRLLVSQMLNKDPKRRPDTWELANQPIIKDAIETFAREQGCEDVVMPLYENDPRIKKGTSSKNKSDYIDCARLSALARNTIQIQNRRLKMFGKIEEKVFFGEDLLRFIHTQSKCTDTVALEIAKEILDTGLISRVGGDPYEFVPQMYYRFREDCSDLPRNMIYLWRKGVREPHEVCTDIIKKINLMLELVEFDAASVKPLPEYTEFLKALGELRQIEIKPYSQAYKLEFFLNIHQIMYFHQTVELLNTKQGWFSDPCQGFFYNIGGESFTLKEIKHGVLRGNKKPPGHYFRLFNETDPRNILPRLTDPRILFLCKDPSNGLGLVTDCYLRKEEVLEEAALEYCSREVCVNLPISEITLPKLFKTYSEDFGGSEAQMLNWILKYCPAGDTSSEEIVRLIHKQVVFLHYRENE